MARFYAFDINFLHRIEGKQWIDSNWCSWRTGTDVCDVFEGKLRSLCNILSIFPSSQIQLLGPSTRLAALLPPTHQNRKSFSDESRNHSLGRFVTQSPTPLPSVKSTERQKPDETSFSMHKKHFAGAFNSTEEQAAHSFIDIHFWFPACRWQERERESYDLECLDKRLLFRLAKSEKAFGSSLNFLLVFRECHIL